MLGRVQPTPYDLRFRLFDIPVRVHPLFWLVMAILSGQNNDLPGVLLFIVCAFVSILVHEFGHGLTSMSLGYRSYEIVLYWMGGYCLSDTERQTPRQRLAVLIMGPGAGFLFLGLLFLLGRLVYGIPFADDVRIIRRLLGLEGVIGVSPAFFRMPAIMRQAYIELAMINLLWGLLNLLPILPLDGGRILEVLLSAYDRRHGMRWALVVSLLTSGILAVVFFRWEQFTMGIWFLCFALISFQNLQLLHESARYGTNEDDADWWKR